MFRRALNGKPELLPFTNKETSKQTRSIKNTCDTGYMYTADRLAQLVEHRTAVREVAGSNLDRTNTQGLKITEEKVLSL